MKKTIFIRFFALILTALPAKSPGFTQSEQRVSQNVLNGNGYPTKLKTNQQITVPEKAHDFTQANRLIELNCEEDKVYIDLQNAAQGALMEKISQEELKAAQKKYDAIKARLENELENYQIVLRLSNG